MVWCVFMIYGMRLAQYAVLPVTAQDPDHLLNMDRPWQERTHRAKWLLAVWLVLEMLILISFGVFVSSEFVVVAIRWLFLDATCMEARIE